MVLWDGSYIHTGPSDHLPDPIDVSGPRPVGQPKLNLGTAGVVAVISGELHCEGSNIKAGTVHAAVLLNLSGG